MKDLTDKQKSILDYIDDFLDKEGMAPTVYEIADHFQIKTSTVFAHLKALQRKDQLSRSSKARSITLRKRSQPHRVTHMSFVMSIPLLGRINAGVPADSPAQNCGEFQLAGALADLAGKHKLFALRVAGESMRDLGILDGDIVVVQSDAEVKSGDVVVALVDNENTVKSYYPQVDTGKIELHPANKDFQVQVYDASAVTVQGRVIALHRDL
ncbi:MAG: repressor LexA [Lentisphaerae bacterium]|nr:repressor LexA [Lentisphaerota bacterium]